MSKQLFSNTMKLSKLILRRDRIRLPIWVVSIVLITILIGIALPGLYTTGAERQIMAESMENPAMVAMLGPVYGIDDYHDGAMMSNFMLLFTALGVGIMSILFVTRHTREDEEEGRIEMVRSLPVGPLSNLASISLVLIAVNVLLSVIVGLGLAALGLEGMDFMGSMLYGVALGVTGIFFLAITALFAQLTSTTRGTIGYSFTFLLIAYLIRAIGDTSNPAISMLSPFGWVLRTEVFVNNYWWPVLLTLGASLAILVFALYLTSIRDLGAGFIPAKPGRKSASAFLQSPLGLALRLQRTAIISWVLGMFILGVSYGSIFGDIEVFLDGSGMIADMLPKIEGVTLAETFLTFLFTIISILSTVPVLMFILKLAGEEKLSRTEHLYARSVSRTNVLVSYLSISFVSSVVMQFMSVIGLWYAAAAVMEEPIALSTILSSAFVYLPAIWAMIGVAVLLIGWLPSWTGMSWLYLGYSFVVVYMGNLLQFPKWMGKLSPFGNVPQLPVDDFSLPKFLILTIIAIALTVLGGIGYNKRDIQG
ncbi:ABC transporter permease [Alkalicella caledoniensis]|uniref:ABC transporter permease n=1 Tax=Alkalicella caledoniensis TaxID=2731377 RepID=A0A7G9W689_ALKCA|nr:ABC transporter permease [Alkalicella caledoniensis]QNO14201.1 ABC transporter permease [Alkalicella caledoniensis]